jgi:hypothetical protein
MGKWSNDIISETQKRSYAPKSTLKSAFSQYPVSLKGFWVLSILDYKIEYVRQNSYKEFIIKRIHSRLIV